MDNTTVLTLNRLLNRLEHNLLSTAADSRLRQSKYERARVSANLEHARTLLLSLNKQCAGARVQSHQQQLQADLAKKRETIKRLSARLAELNELGNAVELQSSDEEHSSIDDDDDGGEHGANNREGSQDDVMSGFGPAQRDVNSGHSFTEEDSRPQPFMTDTTQHRQQQDQSHEAQLRARKPLQVSDNRSSASTTAREQLFAGRKLHPDLETTEALMTHNREEQEALSDSLLRLARALKESSLSFASSLEAEKDVMSRAEGSLDKSAQGMDQAEKKMGLLRRMSEGQGWFGRLKLYGFIAGLWLACFLLVFIGPKLRF